MEEDQGQKLGELLTGIHPVFYYIEAVTGSSVVPILHKVEYSWSGNIFWFIILSEGIKKPVSLDQLFCSIAKSTRCIDRYENKQKYNKF